MAKLGDMFPSKYLAAADCEEEDLVVTISEVKEERLGQGNQAEDKFIVYFNEVDKGLVLNKTNAKSIADLHGGDTDDWEGKRVALYATEVEFQGKRSMGIRIRLKAPKQKGAKNGSAPAAAPEGVVAGVKGVPHPETSDDEEVPF